MAGDHLVGHRLAQRGRDLTLLSRFRDALPSALFERPFGYPKTASPTTSKGNLLEARDLLAASGWRIDDGALRDAGGVPFTLELLTLDPDHARILLPWSAALRQLGIEARVRLVDVSQYTNRTRHHEYEALVQGYGILMPPTLELRSHFHSTSTGREGSRNVVGVSDPVVDFLVEKAEAAETLDQVIAACRALDRVLLWDHYLIPLYAIDQRRTLHWDKFGTSARTALSARLPRRLVVRRIQGGPAQHGTVTAVPGTNTQPAA